MIKKPICKYKVGDILKNKFDNKIKLKIMETKCSSDSYYYGYLYFMRPENIVLSKPDTSSNSFCHYSYCSNMEREFELDNTHKLKMLIENI